MGTGRLIAVLALVACAAAPVDAAGPKTRYERVTAQEQSLRLQTRRPAPLSQIRKVVAAYEAVVRRHPTSGYADNALLQAATISLSAHRIYGSDVDRDVAARMLQWLIDEYPHSSLLTKARQLMKRAKPAERTPASRAAASTPPARPTTPPLSQSFMNEERAAAARETPAPSAAAAGDATPVAGLSATTPTPAASPTLASAAVTRNASSTANTTGTSAARNGTTTLKQVTRTTVGDLVRVSLEFDGEVAYKQEQLSGPARLYFDLPRTQTTAALTDAALSYSDDSVRHIRLGRPKQDMTRLVIDLAGVEKYTVFELYNPYRLTIDLQRRAPRLMPLNARGINAVAPTAPRLASAHVPSDLELVRRIPPRPLPHPLADTPRVTSRPVAAEVASLTRRRPIVASRRHYPAGAPLVAFTPGTAAVSANIARLFVPTPLATNRRGLPLNTTAARAPKTTAVAATIARENAREAAARETAARELAARETAARELAARETAAREKASSEAAARETVASAPRAAAPAPPSLPARPGAPSSLPAPTAPSANAAGGFSLARQLGLGVARIVIDAGHGGHDPGTLGSKVNEAEVVLDVALRLEKLLKNEPGFEVVMTRRTDVFIPLEERTAIANKNEADLFLSIHANASRNREASGVETYHLNFASNPEAEAVAARENAGAVHTMNHLPEVVRAITLNNKLDESRDFAQRVQAAMVGRLKPQNSALKDRGVKQAPFVVLIGAGMPSVLAEIAFLSNKEEGSLARTGAYRQKVAEALFEAVKSYQRSLKTVGTVAEQIDSTDRN